MKSADFIAGFLGARGPSVRRAIPETVLKPRRILLHECPVAGFQHHRGEGVWGFLRPGDALQLRRERHNVHDRYAVGVWFRNEPLGYLPQTDNREAHISRLLESDNPWRRIRISVFMVN
jgi:hypothetical protein